MSILRHKESPWKWHNAVKQRSPPSFDTNSHLSTGFLSPAPNLAEARSRYKSLLWPLLSAKHKNEVQTFGYISPCGRGMKGELWGGVCATGMNWTLLERPGWTEHKITCFPALWGKPDRAKNGHYTISKKKTKSKQTTKKTNPMRCDVLTICILSQKTTTTVLIQVDPRCQPLIWYSYRACRWNSAAQGLQLTASEPGSTASGLSNQGAHRGMINRLSNLIAAAYIESLTEW